MEERNGIDGVKSDQVGLTSYLCAQPASADNTSHRVRCGPGSPVRSDHVDDDRQLRGGIAVDLQCSRRELVVCTHADVDAAFPISETDAGYFEPVDLTEPHTVVGNDVEARFGEHHVVVETFGRTFDLRSHRFDEVDFSLVHSPDLRSGLGEHRRRMGEVTAAFVDNQVYSFTAMSGAPDDRTPESPRVHGWVVDPAFAIDLSGRATTEARRLGDVLSLVLTNEDAQLDRCELGELFVLQLSSASVAVSSAGAAAVLPRRAP